MDALKFLFEDHEVAVARSAGGRRKGALVGWVYPETVIIQYITNIAIHDTVDLLVPMMRAAGSCSLSGRQPSLLGTSAIRRRGNMHQMRLKLMEQLLELLLW